MYLQLESISFPYVTGKYLITLLCISVTLSIGYLLVLVPHIGWAIQMVAFTGTS